jgi:hypothetical protein
MTKRDEATPWYQISFEEKAAVVGALGGITFGYDIGVISGALLSLNKDFGLDPSEEGTHFHTFFLFFDP